MKCSRFFSGLGVSLILAIFFAPAAAAAASDIALTNDHLTFNATTFVEYKKVRIFGTITSGSDDDHKGFVRFFDGETGPQLGGDQPVSVVSKMTDTVFVDVTFTVPGDHTVVAKLFPFEDGDDPSNNIARKTITVLRDTDRDGTPNVLDSDDDNDGVPDESDAFPENAAEKTDSDKDGIGDNADPDDDNDGVPDEQDAFATDPSEHTDSDRDGVGDNTDIFPNDSAETADFDGDGIGDNADTDADNDGVLKDEDENDRNLGPVLKLKTLPKFARTGVAFDLDFTESNDPDGEIKDARLVIEKEDGEKITDMPVLLDSVISYRLNDAGAYTLRFEGVDNKGERRTVNYQVDVRSGLFYMMSISGLILLALAIFIVFAYSRRAPRADKVSAVRRGPAKKRKK